MRTFSAQQRALASAATIKPILLLVLRTYSDRALGTVDKTYYFSDRPVLYDYGNTGTVQQFDSVLLSVTDVTQSVSHVPSPTPAGLEAELRVTLSNLPYRGGDTLIQELRAHNLEFATIELASVYGPLDSDTGLYDLRAYAGDEHMVELRAEIEMAEGIDDQVLQLRCKTTETAVKWVRADDSTKVDPRDLGARLPIVYGAARRVSCINWEVGWKTVLSTPLEAVDTIGGPLDATDITGFPITAFSVQVEGERISISSRASVTAPCLIAGRALDFTALSSHAAGAVVLELPDQIVVALAGTGASHAPLSALDQLYLRNPYNRELFAVRNAPAPVLRDVATSAGNTLSSVTFTQAEMKDLLDACNVSAAVKTQPEFEGSGYAVNNNDTAVPTVASGWRYDTPPSGTHALGIFNNSATSPSFAYHGNWWVNGYVQLTIGAFPSISAISVAIMGTSTYNTVGLGAGAETGIHIGLVGIPGLSDAWTTKVTGAGSGTVAFDSGALEWYGNPVGLAGAKINLTPFSTGGSLAANYFGIAGLKIRYQYLSGTAVRSVDVSIDGAGVGYGLEFLADVSGPTVPHVYVPGYAFEDAASWSVSGCSVAADTTNKTEGSQSLKVSVTETVVESCDSDAGSWSGIRATITNDTGDKTRGSGSMKVVMTTAYSSTAAYKDGLSAADWSSYLIAFDCKLTNPADWHLDAPTTVTPGVFFRFESGGSSNWLDYGFGYHEGLASGNWVTILFDPSARPPYSGAGTPNIAAVTAYYFMVYPPAHSELLEFRVDAFRLIPKTAIAQLNGISPTVNLSAHLKQHKLSARVSDPLAFAAGSKVYVSQTTGSGTTAPTDRRELAIDLPALAAVTFADVENAATDQGSPNAAAVATVGVSIAIRSTPPAALLGPPIVWLDDLRRSDETESHYAASPGALIEQPADIVRHLLTRTCGLADTYADDASFATWAANLPAGFKLGSDLRASGELLPELLARIGYDGRANILRAEGAATSVYKVSCAESDYAWPASSGRVITLSDPPTEVGRNGREIATRFQFVYDRDPSIGSDLSAFRGLVRANPTVSDVSVSAATLATREQEYGRRDAAIGVLLAHYDEASAEDAATYYIIEAGRNAGLFVLQRVQWWEAADLEMFDLIDKVLSWHTGTLKLRVIEVTRKLGAGVVDLRAVEVA